MYAIYKYSMVIVFVLPDHTLTIDNPIHKRVANYLRFKAPWTSIKRGQLNKFQLWKFRRIKEHVFTSKLIFCQNKTYTAKEKNRQNLKSPRHHLQKSRFSYCDHATPQVWLPREKHLHPGKLQAPSIFLCLCWSPPPFRVSPTSGRPEAPSLGQLEMRLTCFYVSDQITINFDEFGQTVVLCDPSKLRCILEYLYCA